MRHRDRAAHAPLGIARQPEQYERRAMRARRVIALHRQHLGRLMLQRVEAVRIARKDLDRRHDRRHPHRHRKHRAGARIGAIPEQMPRADTADHEGGGEIGRDDGVDEPVGKARVEDDRQPRIPPARTDLWR
jgi:hypothetical protein